MLASWDVGFVGHKACDSDPIYGGDAGTRVEAIMNPMHIGSVYPLRDWTHDDVFQYLEDNDVPIQLDRYEKVDGKWRESSDRSENCDYVHACTKCIDKRAGKFVDCPKLSMRIANSVGNVPWADQTKPSYMED